MRTWKDPDKVNDSKAEARRMRIETAGIAPGNFLAMLLFYWVDSADDASGSECKPGVENFFNVKIVIHYRICNSAALPNFESQIHIPYVHNTYLA